MSQKKLSSITEFLLYLSPFFFPLYLFRFRVAGIPFTVLEAYVYLLFGLWFLTFLCGQKIVRKKPVGTFFLAAFLLLAGTTLGALFVQESIALPGGTELAARQTAWGIWKGWVFSSILYFWVLIQMFKHPKQVDRLLRYFVYSGAVLVLVNYGFALFADGFSYDFRLKGFFENPNYLALYCVPAFLLSSVFLFRRQKKTNSSDLLNTAAWAILAHGLFFTKSYGAFLGIFGALILYALVPFIQKPQWRQKMIIGLSALFLLFALLLATQWNSPKFRQALDISGRSSSSVRLEIYRTSLHLIRQHPLVGIGPGLFQAHYQNQAPVVLGRAPLEWNMPHSHNVFLAFWLNAGLFGFVALLLIIILVHTHFTYPLVAFWGLLIHGLFDVPFWKNDLAMVFWLLVGVILILQMSGKKKLSI